MGGRSWTIGSGWRTPVMLFVSFLVLDIVSKWFFRSHSYSVIDGVFSLTPSTNTGSAFGLLQWVPNVVFILLSLFVIVGGIVLMKKGVVSSLFASLFLAGVTGNLVDRLLSGAVTDFIAFSFFPSFNVADSLMVVSVVGLLWWESKGKK